MIRHTMLLCSLRRIIYDLAFLKSLPVVGDFCFEFVQWGSHRGEARKAGGFAAARRSRAGLCVPHKRFAPATDPRLEYRLTIKE